MNKIDKVEGEDTDQRIRNLQDSITKVVYTNVCRGLFSKHKKIYSFLISVAINR
jgi:dynein heavy chain